MSDNTFHPAQGWRNTGVEHSPDWHRPGSHNSYSPCHRNWGQCHFDAFGAGDARRPCSGADVVPLAGCYPLRKVVHQRYNCHSCVRCGKGPRMPGLSGYIQPLASRRSSHGYKLCTPKKSSFWNCPCANNSEGSTWELVRASCPASLQQYFMRNGEMLTSRVFARAPYNTSLPQLLITWDVTAPMVRGPPEVCQRTATIHHAIDICMTKPLQSNQPINLITARICQTLRERLYEGEKKK